MPTITYRKPNGEWGIEGVDLAALPPKVYGALYKLMAMEQALPGIGALPVSVIEQMIADSKDNSPPAHLLVFHVDSVVPPQGPPEAGGWGGSGHFSPLCGGGGSRVY